MKTVVVCNPCMKDVMTNEGYFYEWYMDGEEFTVALLDLPDPDFNTMLDSHSVIVKVNAFSCNFRDRALMHHFAWRCKELSVDRKYFYAPIGSEFAGEVVWAGRKVASFHIGDRVFPNNTYPFKPDGTWGGMVTNFASQRLLLVKDSFLMKIPDGMPDEVAAGFSLSAQTGYSMVRKACLKENENVLITALSSNTSLAIIEKLKYSNVNLYACSRRSQELKEQVKDFKPQPVITKDNVTMQIDTVVYYQITDPKLYTYGVEQPIAAIENLTATTLRNLVGELELDGTLTSRDTINTKMRLVLDEATDPWGIKINRVELKNILPPKDIQQAMEKQMRAERERREAILIAEGEKRSNILVAEGEKEAEVLRAEAKRLATIKEAEGTAEAIRMIIEAHPDQAYLTLKGYEALAAVADGQSTKLIVPTELANITSLLATLKESVILPDPKTKQKEKEKQEPNKK